MKSNVPASLCLASMLACGGAVIAHAATQEPTQPPAPSSAQRQSATDKDVIITGCVQREADYRRAKDAGRGGAAGTGIGAGNEFVLTEASSGSSATATTPSTTGTSGGSMAYELTGPNEGQLSQHVGRRVEITGKLKAAETTAAGRPTGGATAGQPPSGVDVASKDLKLRELEVMSVKEATGTCTPMK
jgi:hypothetical protein